MNKVGESEMTSSGEGSQTTPTNSTTNARIDAQGKEQSVSVAISSTSDVQGEMQMQGTSKGSILSKDKGDENVKLRKRSGSREAEVELDRIPKKKVRFTLPDKADKRTLDREDKNSSVTLDVNSLSGDMVEMKL